MRRVEGVDRYRSPFPLALSMEEEIVSISSNSTEGHFRIMSYLPSQGPPYPVNSRWIYVYVNHRDVF